MCANGCRLLYGPDAEVEIESRPGRGTKIMLKMPVIEGAGGDWERMRGAVEAALRGLRR